MTEDLSIYNFNFKHLCLDSPPSTNYLNFDDLPPLLAPNEIHFGIENAINENDINLNTYELLPISITEMNNNDTNSTTISVPILANNISIENTKTMNSFFTNSVQTTENSELFDFDMELEYLLTEVVEPQFENNSWLPYLPEKTALCNEFCNDFLKESAEQLQLQSHSPMEVLGVNLDLYSNQIINLDEMESIKQESQENIPVHSILFKSESKTNTKELQSEYKFFNEYEQLLKFNRRRLLLHDKIMQSNNQISKKRIQNSDSQEYIEKKSIQNDEKTFRCTYEACEKVYAKASHLKAHLRRHSGEKPFHCTWPKCEWKFSRSDELARHKRSHSGIKPYKCEMCEKCFSRSDHLAKHRKVHKKRLAQYGINFFPMNNKKPDRRYGTNRYVTRL